MTFNHKKLTMLLMLIALIAMMAPSAVGQSKVGTSAMPFLGTSIGPRATAIGGAFTAIADDASTMWYNPGGIAVLERSQFLFAHTSWLVDTQINWFGLVIRPTRSDAIGISLAQLAYGEEEVTTVEQPEGTGNFWSARDLVMSASYARSLTDRFSIGGSFKYINQEIWNESATAIALDLGLVFVTPFDDLRLGMAINNFGSEMQMQGSDMLARIDLDPENTGHNENIVGYLKTDSWPLPLFFRVGLAYDILKGNPYRLTLTTDALRPSDNSGSLNIGSEFAFNELVFLRVGYKSLFLEESEEGLTAGVGLNYRMGNMQYILDYTFADFGLFESIQMFSVGVSF